MVTGLEKFKEYFKDYTDSYVLIGGAACDILFTENEANFRATRDLDMVLIVEELSKEFVATFWEFIKDGQYRHVFGSKKSPQFYRFDQPQVQGFPKMIELFSRMNFALKNNVGITPIHIDDTVSSLSAILLDDDYYGLLVDGKVVENGCSVLRSEYLILFKSKAYLDLKKRKEQGETIDSTDIKKHKKDILRLSVEMVLNPVCSLPISVKNDIKQFISQLENDPYDSNSLKFYKTTTQQIINRLETIFLEAPE